MSEFQGMRVVPGKEWTVDDVAKDEIGTIIKYDQVEGSKKYVNIIVAWDSGKETFLKYPTGDVLKIVNTDILGVLHEKRCIACNMEVVGILWMCAQKECGEKDINLCSFCYHGDKHLTDHKFYRIDMKEKRSWVIRPERKKSQKISLHGICNGATVIRRDKGKSTQDAEGTNASQRTDRRTGLRIRRNPPINPDEGRVIGFAFRNESWIAQVKWNRQSQLDSSCLAEDLVMSEVFQRKHPLECTKPKTWQSVYRDHLPEPKDLDLGEYGIEEMDYEQMQKMMAVSESKNKEEFTIARMKYGFENLCQGDVILEVKPEPEDNKWMCGLLRGQDVKFPARLAKIEVVTKEEYENLKSDQMNAGSEFTIARVKYGFEEKFIEGDIIFNVKPKPGNDKNWMCGLLRDQNVEFPASIVKIENLTRDEYQKLKSYQTKEGAGAEQRYVNSGNKPPILMPRKKAETKPKAGNIIFEAGDKVEMKNISDDEIREKQLGYGGWYDFMDEIRGKEGVIVEEMKPPSKGVIVDFKKVRRPWLNPEILINLGTQCENELPSSPFGSFNERL